MDLLNESQLRLVAGFFSNLAVVWFTGAFAIANNWLIRAELLASGGFALFIGILFIREVKV